MGGSLVLFVLAVTALAQESRAPIDTREPVAVVAPLVTASATAERVRFVAPGTVIQLRLEVYSETGQKVFDTELHGGNVLDWHLQDGGGQRLSANSYACVLTIKSLSGRLSQRVGLVTVNENQAQVRVGVAGEVLLSVAQQQAIGPVEGNAAFTSVQGTPTEAITAITHDGNNGQITSTSGPLTFRTGDVFAGKDQEHMRITEDGRVGIGTNVPEAALDVAGAVRVSEGVRFSDGTTLDATSGKLIMHDAAGELVPDSAGSGTVNRLAKWTETGGTGTLSDSSVFETGGQVGIGTTTPNANAAVHADRTQNTGTALFVTNSSPGTGALASMRAGLNPANYAVDYASLNILGANWPAGLGGAPLKGRTVLIEGSGSNFGIGNINPTEPIVFYTTPSRVERMRVTAAGNVGIGTTEPSFRLAVVDPSNAGLRVQTSVAGGAVASFGGFGDFQIDAPNVVGGRFAVKESGKVGIGTNSPLAALELRAGADNDGNGPSAMAFQWYLGGFRHWIRTRHNSVIGSGNAIDFFVNGSTTPEGSTGPGLGSGSQFVMTLDSGRVGIGTTSPGEILTVEGKIHSTFGGFKFPDGSVQTTAANATYTIGRTSNDPQILLTPVITSILHLNLPAGTYLLTATLVLINDADYFGQDNSRRISCRFSGEGPHDSTITIGGQAFATMPLHTVLSISSGGADVVCFSQAIASNTVHVFDRRLTAVKIENNVVVQ